MPGSPATAPNRTPSARGAVAGRVDEHADAGCRGGELTAARMLGVRLQGVLATNEREFDAVFDTLRRSGADALVISADPVFSAKSEQLAALTLRHKLPAVHESRRSQPCQPPCKYGVPSRRRYGMPPFLSA
jgi:hypothetical protein